MIHRNMLSTCNTQEGFANDALEQFNEGLVPSLSLSSNIMSLPLGFLLASGHERPAHHTPDSRGLGSRPVHKHEVPTPPTLSREYISHAPPQSPPLPPLDPSSIPTPSLSLFPSESTRRHLLPQAMTDLKLCMEFGSLPLTSFSHFVARELFPCPKLFPRFMDLPKEIRRIVFRSCDTPTLYHLTHTSSYTRFECLEIFWESENNIWYRPTHTHLTFNRKVSPIYHCPEFASRVTQVEIPLYFADYREMVYKGREFWDRLQELFPSARKVVLSGKEPRHPQLASEDNNPYFFISELVAFAPPHITLFIAFDYYGIYDMDECALCHRLWRVKAHCWSLVEDIWTPMRVLLPRKKVPCGLLNDLLTSDRLFALSWREIKAINWLKLETYARYSDKSGIECPDTECKSFKFHTLRDFKKHISEKRHSGPFYTHDHNLALCHQNTPLDVKAILDMKQRCVGEIVLTRTALNHKLRDQYRRPGDIKRQFEEALTAQMKAHGYLAPNESLEDSDLWCDNYEIFEYDCPEYPDPKVIDPEYPWEEDLDHYYTGEEYSDHYFAGEEYFEYPE